VKAGIRSQDQQFVTDAKGNRVGVLLDLKTYDWLREAAEELADIEAYDEARTSVAAEVERGEFCTLEDYKRSRKRKRK
jgi:hypothetical protein